MLAASAALASTIENLPEGATVAVKCGEYAVPSAAFVGFGEGKTEGVFSLALDENGTVTIGGEEIPVKPTIGDLDGEGAVATQPFAVGKGTVTVTVKAIPGLRYELRRRETLSAPVGEGADGTGWDEVGESVVATGTRVTLTDANPPKGGAFYRVVVRVEEF